MAIKGKKKKRLGMGISGMLSKPVPVVVDPPEAADAPSPTRHTLSPQSRAIGGAPASGGAAASELGLAQVQVDRISPSAQQPRQRMEPKGIEQLAASIKSSGLIQPILIRPAGSDGMHELIAGERRWRAAVVAGLAAIPCIIQDVDSQTAAEFGLIENLQREDLNAIEKADAFRSLQHGFGLTHQEIATRVGWTRAAVTNQLRLCALDASTRAMVHAGALDGGHARALLAVSDVALREDLAKQAIQEGWSVRVLEQRVRKAVGRGSAPGGGTKAASARRSHLDDLEKQLSDALGTAVRITTNAAGFKGSLRLAFYDLDQFDGLLQRLGVTPR
jgi:ParB family chromosome partitioning protein